MKMNYALVFGLFLTTGLIAQTDDTSPAPAGPAIAAPSLSIEPAPAETNTAVVEAQPAAPAAQPAAKPAAKPAANKAAPARRTVVEKTVSLVPGPAVVTGNHVNVRGRSTILSEVLTQFNKGDVVTVIEQVENKWSKGNDMKQWARIAYPSNAPVWVFGAFIGADKTVTAPRLNLRGGPGENYSIVGRLTKGEKVNEITTKGEWVKIEPPATATAYIAAMYLEQDPTLLASAKPVEPAPGLEPASTNEVTDVEPVIAPTVDTAATNPVVAQVEPEAPEAPDETMTPEDVMDEPPQPRIVMREGIVRGATSIQAPSYYALAGMDTGRTINYLYTSSTNVNLGQYVGLHIIATGEESLDERWPNTPVLTLQRIQVVDE